jgi:hypothetical protein
MADHTAVERFPIRIGRRSRLLLRFVFGVRPDNAFVDVGDELDAHFGYGRLRTPVTNIRSWRIEGPWLWVTAIGIRRGIRDGVFAFDGVHTGGVRIDFRERVPLLRLFRTPALYVTVEDPEAFTAALASRGIPGEDVRRR